MEMANMKSIVTDPKTDARNINNRTLNLIIS